jgi:hypothetical protein
MIRLSVALIAMLSVGHANATEVHFCWRGAEGYRLVGQMAFPDRLAQADLITEEDVTAFQITGYLEGVVIGQWSLPQLRPDTSWELNFMPREMAFAMGGDTSSSMSQAWNANGAVEDCGTPGFGFNAGSNAQDVCIDGRWIAESGIPYETPLIARPVGEALDCGIDAQISWFVGHLHAARMQKS